MNEDEEIDSIMEGRPRIRKQDGSKEMSRLCYAASKGMSSGTFDYVGSPLQVLHPSTQIITNPLRLRTF